MYTDKELANKINRQKINFETFEYKKNQDSLRFNSTKDETYQDKFLLPRVIFDCKRDKIMPKLSYLFCANQRYLLSKRIMLCFNSTFNAMFTDLAEVFVAHKKLKKN